MFDPHVVEDSCFEYTPLQQLMNALSYFSFDQRSQPEATPYQK